MISKLECVKCGYRFNYQFIPGASVTSVRLGAARYMRCPGCRRWGKFSLSSAGSDAGLPTYSDYRMTARYLPVFVVPIGAWIFIGTALIAYARLHVNPIILIAVPILAMEAALAAAMQLKLMPQKIQ